MKHNLINYLSGSSFRQSFITTGGTIINAFLGLCFYALIARYLGPAKFGQLAFFIAVGTLFADVGDFGLGTALVKFGRDDIFSSVFTLTLIQRAILTLCLIIMLSFINIFYPLGFWPAFVAFSLLLISTTLQSLIAKQMFFEMVCVLIFANIIRIVFTLVLFFNNNLQLNILIFIFILANIGGFLLGIFLLKIKTQVKLLKLADWKKTVYQIANFTGWMGASFSVSAITTRLDIPLTFYLSGDLSAGIYSLAQKLMSIFPQLGASIDGVFAPKFSHEDRKKHFHDYLFTSVLMAGSLIFVYPLCKFLIPLILGDKYLPSLPIFGILLLGVGLFFLTGPFAASNLYFHGKSKLHFFSSLSQLTISVPLYFILIPNFGGVGAAFVFVIVNLFNLIFNASAYIFLNKSNNNL